MTALFNALQEILFTLSRNKLRTFLTAFGVFWGIFMLILLLGAGRGLQNGITSNFGADAQDSVWITTRKTSVPYMGLGVGRDIRLTTKDVIAISKLPNVKIASAEQNLNGVVRHQNVSQSYSVLGVGDGYFDLKIGQDQRLGRKLNTLDSDQRRKVAAIGTLVAKTLFGEQDPVGKRIYINNIAFTVIGVFYDKGNNGRMSERIYIPLSLHQTTFGKGENFVNVITYQPKSSVDPWKTEEDVMAFLRARHQVSPKDRSAIRSNNLLRQGQWVFALFSAINAFIWFVGLGTLTAGVVGISNIMMITVKERTVEIGVRKALGATPTSIIFSLLFESILVTATAGYFGLVLGVGLLEGVNALTASLQVKMPYFQRPEVNFQLALTAIAVLVCAGAIAGFAPAWRAARIAPVEAMRNA